MTVQPSVTVWTILCFLALALILDRLLFRPMLSFMDRRRAKIEQAKAEKAEAVRERDDQIVRCREEHAAQEKQMLQDTVSEIERIRSENERRAAGKKAEIEARLAEEREALQEESARILEAAAARSDELAAAFVERLSFGSEWDATPDARRH